MLKEFNIDNYRYVEESLTFSQWLKDHRPQKNHLDPEARLDGMLYEHEGEQWEYIVQLPTMKFWTLYEEAGQLKIRNGYQVRGRIGYIVTEAPHNAHRTILIEDVTQEMLNHRPHHVYSWYSTELLGESRENIKDMRSKFNPENNFTFSEWLQAYKPQPNHLDHKARLSGLLYEHDGEQELYIQTLPFSAFWTVYEHDGTYGLLDVASKKDPVLEIRNGMYSVSGRIGYVVCQVPHDQFKTLLVNGLSRGMLEHRLGSDH